MCTQFLAVTSLLATSTMLGSSLFVTPCSPVSAMTESQSSFALESVPKAFAAIDEKAGVELKSTMPSNWQDFTSNSGNFTVKAPTAPEESATNDDDGGKSYSFAFYQGSSFYYIRYSDNPAFENNFTPQQIREVLAAAPAAFAEGSGGKITGKRPVNMANYEGIEFDFRIKEIPGKGRAYLVKGRLYMLVGAGDGGNTEAFLNSFKLLK